MPENNEGITIHGETVSFEGVANYFSEAWRSHDIEAMLDYREAQVRTENRVLQGLKDYGWMAAVLVGAAVAIYILAGVFGSPDATNVVVETPRVISQGAGATIS